MSLPLVLSVLVLCVQEVLLKKATGQKLGLSIRGGGKGSKGNPLDPNDEGIFVSKVSEMVDLLGQVKVNCSISRGSQCIITLPLPLLLPPGCQGWCGRELRRAGRGDEDRGGERDLSPGGVALAGGEGPEVLSAAVHHCLQRLRRTGGDEEEVPGGHTGGRHPLLRHSGIPQ